MGQPERAGAQDGAVAPALGAGRREMAERVGARVAVGAGVGGAAAADRIEDDDDRAAQSGSLLADDARRLRFHREGGGEQGPGIVAARRGENLARRAALDHLAAAHDDDLARQRPDDLEIVRNEQIGERAALLQVAQQVDDLRLHRHVERRGRLVEDDEFGIERHRAGDGDALALAAGEFVRVAVHAGGIDAGVGERAGDRLAALGGVEPRLLRDQSLFDDLGDRQPRRQRAERVLEDDLHVAPERPHLSDRQAAKARPQ